MKRTISIIVAILLCVSMLAMSVLAVMASDITEDSEPNPDNFIPAESIEKISPEAEENVLKIYASGEVLSEINDDTDGQIPVYETVPFEGIGYRIFSAEDIYDENDRLIYENSELVCDKILTDENGVAEIEDLPNGRYMVRTLENDKLLSDYVDPGDRIVNYTSEGTVLSFNYERKKIDICGQIDALEEEENGTLATIAYGLFAIDNLGRDEEEAAFTLSVPIETAYVDEDGTIQFETDLPSGTYEIKQLSSSDEDLEDDTVYQIIFNAATADDSTDTQIISFTSGTVVRDNMDLNESDSEAMTEEGRVIVIAEDENGDGIKGIEYALIDESEKTVSSGVTDAEGELYLDAEFGKYLLQEISCPDEYVSNDRAMEIELTEDTPVYKLAVTYGSSGITENEDTNESTEESPSSSSNVKTVSTVSSTGAENTATVSETASDDTDTDDEATVVTSETTETVTTGILYVTVTDSETGEPLEGVSVDIVNSENVAVDSGTTGSNGQVMFELEAGTYTVVETASAEGYDLPDGDTTVTIEAGDSINVSIVNVPSSDDVQGGAAKTGDESSMTMWIVLGILAVIVIAVLVVVYIRRKHQD